MYPSTPTAWRSPIKYLYCGMAMAAVEVTIERYVVQMTKIGILEYVAETIVKREERIAFVENVVSTIVKKRRKNYS